MKNKRKNFKDIEEFKYYLFNKKNKMQTTGYISDKDHLYSLEEGEDVWVDCNTDKHYFEENNFKKFNNKKNTFVFTNIVAIYNLEFGNDFSPKYVDIYYIDYVKKELKQIWDGWNNIYG